jgi:hypothetical protein
VAIQQTTYQIARATYLDPEKVDAETSAAAHPLEIAPVKTKSLETSTAELLSGSDDARAKAITPAREGRQTIPIRICEDHNPVSESTVDKMPTEQTH